MWGKREGGKVGREGWERRLGEKVGREGGEGRWGKREGGSITLARAQLLSETGETDQYRETERVRAILGTILRHLEGAVHWHSNEVFLPAFV